MPQSCVSSGANWRLLAKPGWPDLAILLDPDRHFVMIDAKMVRHFVQQGGAYLLSNALRVAMTVRLDGALIDGDALRQHHSLVALRSQRRTLVESEQRVALSGADPSQHLSARLFLHQHRQVFHALPEFQRDAIQRLFHQRLEDRK